MYQFKVFSLKIKTDFNFHKNLLKLSLKSQIDIEMNFQFDFVNHQKSIWKCNLKIVLVNIHWIYTNLIKFSE